jgi:hypothetical protein
MATGISRFEQKLTASERILEDLLETEELEAISFVSFFFSSLGSFCHFSLHRQVDRGVQAQAALVRAERRVELHAVAAVDLEVAGIVLPHDAELDDALGDRHNLERRAEFGVLLEEGAVLERGDELCRKSVSAPVRSRKLIKCSAALVVLTLVRLLELGLTGEVRHGGGGGWGGDGRRGW